jgi:hypothetical protein
VSFQAQTPADIPNPTWAIYEDPRQLATDAAEAYVLEPSDASPAAAYPGRHSTGASPPSEGVQAENVSADSVEVARNNHHSPKVVPSELLLPDQNHKDPTQSQHGLHAAVYASCQQPAAVEKLVYSQGSQPQKQQQQQLQHVSTQEHRQKASDACGAGDGGCHDPLQLPQRFQSQAQHAHDDSQNSHRDGTSQLPAGTRDDIRGGLIGSQAQPSSIHAPTVGASKPLNVPEQDQEQSQLQHLRTEPADSGVDVVSTQMPSKACTVSHQQANMHSHERTDDPSHRSGEGGSGTERRDSQHASKASQNSGMLELLRSFNDGNSGEQEFYLTDGTDSENILEPSVGASNPAHADAAAVNMNARATPQDTRGGSVSCAAPQKEAERPPSNSVQEAAYLKTTQKLRSDVGDRKPGHAGTDTDAEAAREGARGAVGNPSGSQKRSRRTEMTTPLLNGAPKQPRNGSGTSTCFLLVVCCLHCLASLSLSSNCQACSDGYCMYGKYTACRHWRWACMWK